MFERLPARLADLTSAPAAPRRDQSPIPRIQAVYFFSEGGTPFYVGRSNNLNQRLAQHTQPGSRQNRASFAFRIALDEAADEGIRPSGTRDEQATHPRVSELFRLAKTRVADMDVQFIELDDAVEQAVFEIYAAESLGTRYNEFGNH